MGARLRSIVLRTSGVTAILMLVVAFFIAASEALSLPCAIDAQRHTLLALYLAIHAFLMSEATQQAYFTVARNRLAVFGRNILVVLPLAIFSFVNLYIVNIAWTQEAERTWIIVLAFPAIIGLWLVFQILSDNYNKRNRKDTGIRNAGDPDAWTLSLEDMRALIARKEPADPRLVFEEGVLRAITAGAYAFVCISLVLVGIFLSVLLNGILFDDYGAEVARVVWAFPLVFADAFMEFQRFWIVGTAAVFGVFLLYGFLLASIAYLARLVKGESERELTEGDFVFIDRSMRSIADYIRGQTYPPRFVKLYNRIGPWPLLVMLALFFVPSVFDPLTLVEKQRTAGLNWHLYESRLLGYLFVGILAAMMLSESLRRFLIIPYKEFAEYAVVKGGFNRANQGKGGLEDYFDFLVKLVQRDKIGTSTSINVKAFIQALARENVRRIHTISGVLVTLTLGTTVLDANSYYLFSEEKIEYSRFWSLEVVTLRYEDVPRVETQCRLSGAGTPFLIYQVYFSDDVKRDLMRNMNEARDLKNVVSDLDALEKIDAKFVDATVSFDVIKLESDDAVDAPGFEAGCLEALAERLDADTYERIAKLLHAPARLVEEGRR